MAAGSLHHSSLLEDALTGCRGGKLPALLSLTGSLFLRRSAFHWGLWVSERRLLEKQLIMWLISNPRHFLQIGRFP